MQCSLIAFLLLVLPTLVSGAKPGTLLWTYSTPVYSKPELPLIGLERQSIECIWYAPYVDRKELYVFSQGYSRDKALPNTRRVDGFNLVTGKKVSSRKLETDPRYASEKTGSVNDFKPVSSLRILEFSDVYVAGEYAKGEEIEREQGHSRPVYWVMKALAGDNERLHRLRDYEYVIQLNSDFLTTKVLTPGKSVEDSPWYIRTPPTAEPRQLTLPRGTRIAQYFKSLYIYYLGKSGIKVTDSNDRVLWEDSRYHDKYYECSPRYCVIIQPGGFEIRSLATGIVLCSPKQRIQKPVSFMDDYLLVHEVLETTDSAGTFSAKGENEHLYRGKDLIWSKHVKYGELVIVRAGNNPVLAGNGEIIWPTTGDHIRMKGSPVLCDGEVLVTKNRDTVFVYSI